jgi:hypothetical protein
LCRLAPCSAPPGSRADHLAWWLRAFPTPMPTYRATAAYRPPLSLLGGPTSTLSFSGPASTLPAPCWAAAVLPPTGHRCVRPAPATPSVRLPCRAAGHPALRAMVSTLPARCLPTQSARVFDTWALLACSLLGVTVPVNSQRPPCPCSRLQCFVRLCRVLSCFLCLICLA